MTREEKIEHYLPLAQGIAGSRFRKLGPTMRRLLVIEYQDIYHCAVVGLIEAVDDYDGRGQEEQFLASRTFYAVINYLRSFPWFNWRSGESYERTSDSDIVARIDPMERVESAILLDQLLKRTTPRRRAILGAILEGISQRQLADQLGVTESAVSDLKHRTIDAMRLAANSASADQARQ
jgi:RNA polymerase sigma factor (sigma-70 family)